MDTDSLSKETYEAVIIKAEYLEKSRQLALSINELKVF